MDLALIAATASAAEPCPPAGRRPQEGMSLIEVMLASLLFLAISLGVVPLFTQSMISNSSGNDSTKAANFARARTEEMLHLPFNHQDLTIEAGSEKRSQEYWERSGETWHPFPIPAVGDAEWTRTTIIRQYNVEAMEDDAVQIAEALPVGTDPSLVHLKEIEVQVAQAGGLLTSSAKSIAVRTLRSH